MYDPLNAVARQRGEKNTRFDRHTIRNAIAGRTPREASTLMWMVVAWGTTAEEMARVIEDHRRWRDRQRVQAKREKTQPPPNPEPTLAAPVNVPNDPSETTRTLVAPSPIIVPTGEGLPSRHQALPQYEPEVDATQRRTLILGTFGIVASIPAHLTTGDPVVSAIGHLLELESAPHPETIDRLDGIVEQLGEHYSQTPADVMYGRVNGTLESVRALRNYSAPKYHRRLLSVAGWLTAMLANALYDLTDVVASDTAAMTAMEYGRHAKDDRLIAFVHDRSAMRAENAGRYAAALDHFRASSSSAPHDAAVRVRALAATARIYARLGHHDRAQVSLTDAEQAYDCLPAREVGDGSLTVSTIAVADAVSSAAELRGNVDSAKQSLQCTIDYYANLPLSRQRPTRLALAHLRMAHLLARSVGPEEATAEAAAALSTSRMVLPILLQAEQLVVVLHRRWPGDQHVRDLRDRLIALVHATNLSDA